MKVNELCATNSQIADVIRRSNSHTNAKARVARVLREINIKISANIRESNHPDYTGDFFETGIEIDFRGIRAELSPSVNLYTCSHAPSNFFSHKIARRA